MSRELQIAQKEIIGTVQNRIREMLKSNELHLPPNYSAENAIKTFWLTLQDTVDMNKKPALEVCTPKSVIEAMTYVVIMGLTSMKNQVYPIVYGNKLHAQPSYFGWQTIFKRLLPGATLVAQVVYKNDEFEYDHKDGQKVITKHKQKIDNINNSQIVGAYCVITYPDGKIRTEIMTINEIYESWKMSKARPFDEKGNLKPFSVHARFTQEMAKRTVLVRAAKHDIFSSDDADRHIEVIKKVIEAEFEDTDDPLVEAEEKANKEELIPDTTPKEKPKAQRQKKTETEPEPEEQTIDLNHEKPSTDAQIKLINNLVAFLVDKGVDETDIYTEMVQTYGTQMMEELSHSNAEDYIKLLRSKQKELEL